MGAIKLDLTGQTIGQFTVLRRDPSSARVKWICRCTCGTERSIFAGNLRASRSNTTCYCNWGKRKDGPNLTEMPGYKTWEQMISRCGNQKLPVYANYGGRGIEVCERWKCSFIAFIEDVGPRPSPKHSLERIDNEKGYEPGNCKWATPLEQHNNKRTNHVVSYRGASMTLSQAVTASGNIVTRYTAGSRLRSGWSLEEALETPARLKVRATV